MGATQMTMIQELISGYDRNQWLIEEQTSGLTTADSLLQLPFRSNCLNWVMGHIVVHRDKSLDLLGEAGVCAEAETALYNRGAAPISADNAAQALTLERLQQLSELANQRLRAALEALPVDNLAQVVDKARGRTLGQRLVFLLWHETYHIGQMEIFRQLAGMDDAVI